MKVKEVLYAAVGAPVVVAKRVGERAGGISTKVSEKANAYGQNLEKTVDGWAVEGERVVGRMSERKVVDEITSKVDLEQAKEQVSKLRDQLEDMLATWRHSFRPEKAEEAKSGDNSKPAAKKPATKAPAKKPAAKSTSKTSAAKTTKSTAAKTSSSKSESDKAEPAAEAGEAVDASKAS